MSLTEQRSRGHTVQPSDTISLFSASAGRRDFGASIRKPKITKYRPKGENEYALENQCFICQCKFTMSKRRHHCRFWAHSVCDDHSMKRKKMNMQEFRCCDVCDRGMIESKLREHYQGELERLQEILDAKTEQVTELHRYSTNRLQEKSQLEREMDKLDRQEKIIEDAHASEAQVEQQRFAENRQIIENLNQDLQVSTDRKEAHFAQKVEIDEKVKGLQKQLDQATANKETVDQQVTEIMNQIQGSLSKDQLRQIACRKCHKKLAVKSKKFKHVGSFAAIEEEDEEAKSTFSGESSNTGQINKQTKEHTSANFSMFSSDAPASRHSAKTGNTCSGCIIF